jgi:hypothetical protein
MSNTVYITFDREVAGYEPQDRCWLAHVFYEPPFEEIARRLEVKQLHDFWSMDPDLLDEYFDDTEERESLKRKQGPAKYFDPTEALISVRAILGQLRRAPLQLERHGKNVTQDLLDELAEVERALQQAEEQGAKFYFFVYW